MGEHRQSEEELYSKRYLTFKQALRVSGTTRQTLRRAIDRGYLDRIWIDYQEHIPVWSLLQWLDHQHWDYGRATTNTIAVAIEYLLEMRAI